MGHSEAAARVKPIYTARLCCNPQSTHAPPRRDRGGQNTCLDIPLAVVCRSSLARKQSRLALPKLEKKIKVGKLEDQTGRLGVM